MEIKDIQDKNVWEDFLVKCEEKTFLQSWNWGEFQQNIGNRIWRFGLYQNGILVCLAFITKIEAKRGKFLLIQHGPTVFKIEAGGPIFKLDILKVLLEKLKVIAREENCSFIRINPLWEKNRENQSILKNLGFREAPLHANAYEATWKLDIALSEEEILKNMRKTTRYLIRQALKIPELEIVKSEAMEHINLFQELNLAVSKYQKFIPFPSDFVKNEFDIFLRDKQALLFFGKYEKEVIASALIIFWSDIAFYHQAALHPKYHKTPIAYFLQWEAIKEAKKRGCRIYDFWGYIDPQKNPSHPWAGPTLFKMGFGGYKKEYVQTQDYPLSFKYFLTYIFEKLRKIKRRL
ncbi:MAG: peptidoglycan bridge formation glycyltransferase FemA/FemB family protein [Patescibacteria group bacterium]